MWSAIIINFFFVINKKINGKNIWGPEAMSSPPLFWAWIQIFHIVHYIIKRNILLNVVEQKFSICSSCCFLEVTNQLYNYQYIFLHTTKINVISLKMSKALLSFGNGSGMHITLLKWRFKHLKVDSKFINKKNKDWHKV